MSDRVDPIHTVAVPHEQHSSAASDRDETAPTAPRAETAPNFGPPAAPGEAGTLGPYRVVKELGKGGMGAVYLAVDTRLDRKLAIKVMLPEFAADSVAKERFLREARAAAKISHDNVVIVHEADERDGVPYIAMQYLQGYPLDEYLKTKGAPALPHVLRIARETALGLAAAHALGLVHRDIKPANLWLEAPYGRVKVLDFGLAKPVDAEAELTKSGAVVGTPAYMSPEQARGQKVDARTDLFSLGAVLYRLCTGKTPFDGPNVMAVLMALGTEDPTPVRELNPNVPEPLAQLIHQLLAKKPDDRPQTATEVAKVLRAILEQLAAPTAPESPVPMATAADLSTSLPIVVHALPMQPPIVVPMQITVQSESAFADLDAPDAPAAPRPERKKAGGKGMLVAAVGAVLLAGAAVAVVVPLMNKKGDPGAENKAPDDGPPPGDAGKARKPVAKGPNQPTQAEGPLPPLPAWAGWKPVPVGESPFDKLDPNEIPKDERFDYQPKELVAVVGSQAVRRHWGQIASVEVLPGGKTVLTHGADGIKVWDLPTRRVVRTLPSSNGHIFARTDSQVVGPYRFEVLDITQPDGAPKPPAFPNADSATLFGMDAGRICDVFEGGKTWLCTSTYDYHLRRSSGSGEARLTLVDASGPVPKVLQKIAHRGWASSPGGNWLLYRDLDNKLQFAEVRQGQLTGTRVLALPKADECRPYTVSADGKNVVVWVEKEYQVWDVSAGEPKLRAKVPDTTGGWIVRVSPDGSRLGIYWGRGLEVYDITTATLRLMGGPVADSGGNIYPFAFTNDSKQVVTGDANGHVRFWDVSGEAMSELAPEFDAGTAFVCPVNGDAKAQIAGGPGQLLLTRYDSTIEAWTLAGSQPQPLPGNLVQVKMSSFVATGRNCVTVSQDQDPLNLYTQQGNEWKKVGPLGKGINPDRTLYRLSEDGQQLVGFRSELDGLAAWDLTKTPPTETWTWKAEGYQYNPVYRRLWLAPGKQLLAMNGTRAGVTSVHLVDLRGGQPKFVATLPQPNVYSVAFSPDSRYLAYGGACPLKLIDLSTAQPKEVFAQNTSTSWVAFHPSGKWLVSAGGSRVNIRSVPDGKVVKEWTFPGDVGWTEFAHDGRHLFTHNANGTVYVLRLPDLEK